VKTPLIRPTTLWKALAPLLALGTAVLHAADPVKSAFFPNTEIKNAGASVVVDALGGTHMAYRHYVPLADQPRAVYLYCPPDHDCSAAGSWSSVALGDSVTRVQLAVNAAGQPRMLLRTASQQPGLDSEYHFAACDAGCTDPSGWTVTLVRTNYGTTIFELNDDILPHRSFALDPQGRPRFVYVDRNYPAEPDHIGSFYVWCDAECTLADNWREVRITETTEYDSEPAMGVSLAFTRDGQPRILANVIALAQNENTNGIFYLWCDLDCGAAGSWQRTLLVPRGYGQNPSWDLELDQNDRPRAAIYFGSFDDGGGNFLIYVWCDENCSLADSWFYNDPGLGARNGLHPDLELTINGSPRIAYMHGNTSGLGYLSCDVNCESDDPQWRATVIETAQDLATEWPVPRPSGCDAGLWSTQSPMLALDAAGNARVAYDARYDTRCWYDDPADNQPPYTRFEALWRAVRGVAFPHGYRGL